MTAVEIQAEDFSQSTLALTSKLLSENPEYYTIWNDRRRILQHILSDKSSASPETTAKLLSSDLAFLLPLLKLYPKCYWIWNHRLWLLEQYSVHLPASAARKAWQGELALVGMMHARDSRNFHGWDYRRIVVERLRRFETEAAAQETDDTLAGKEQETSQDPATSLVESEFAYTRKMVAQNLSNFSAWHARSKLIPLVLAARNASPADRRALFVTELSYLKEALLMDPYDQSLWKYHQYLMFVLMSAPDASQTWVEFRDEDREQLLSAEIADFKELLDDTTDCKWLYLNLVQYTAQYLGLNGRNKTAPTAELRDWMQRLKDLDPLRIGRWNDLERTLNL